MKITKKAIAGLLALCMIISCIGVLPAKAANEVDVTDSITMTDRSTDWSTDTTYIKIQFGVSNVKETNVKNDYYVNDHANDAAIDPAEWLYINGKSIRTHINEYDGTDQGTNFPMNLGAAFNPICFYAATDSFKIYVLDSYLAHGTFSMTIKEGFQWENTDGQVLVVNEDVTYKWVNGVFTKSDAVLSEVDVTDEVTMSDMGTAISQDTTTISIKFDSHSVAPASGDGTYCINNNANTNGIDPAKYILVNGKTVRSHLNDYADSGSDIRGTAFPMNDNIKYNPILIYCDTGSNFLRISILTSYLERGDFEVVLKGGFTWANADGEILTVSKNVTYQYVDGTFQKVADVTTRDVTRGVRMKDVGSGVSSDTTTITIYPGEFDVTPSSGDTIYCANDNTKNGIDVAEYVLVDGKSVRKHIEDYPEDATWGTPFPMSAGKTYNPILMYFEAERGYFRISVLNSYLEQGTYEVTLKKGFSWATQNGETLVVNRDVTFGYRDGKFVSVGRTLLSFENETTSNVGSALGVASTAYSAPTLSVVEEGTDRRKGAKVEWSYDGSKAVYMHKFQDGAWAEGFIEDADNYLYLRLWVCNPSHVYFDMSFVLEGENTVNYYDMSKAKLITKDGQQVAAEIASASELGTSSGMRIAKQFEGWVVLPLTTDNLKASNGYTTTLSAFADATTVSIENRRVQVNQSTQDYYVLDELVLDYTILGNIKSTEDGAEYDKFDVTEKGTSSLKNVIFMIGDGMGDGSLAAARLQRSTLHLDSISRAGYIGTNEAGDSLTDSAAAGTALATGYKTLNGMVGLTPAQLPVMNLSEWMLQFGKKVGLVTSSYMVDATPATFASHTAARSNYASIAKDMVDLELDLLLGGGKTQFSSTMTGEDGKTITGIDYAKNAGYQYITTKDEMNNLTSDKVLGLFTNDTLSYASGRTTTEPTLEEMTETALEFLENGDKGFFVMIEGGNIDHANHANEGQNTITETIEFDDAVKVAKDYVDTHPDTLLIITADHETGGVKVVNNQVTFSTTDHTTEAVPYYVYGAGAKYFEGLTDNTQINYAIKAATADGQNTGATSILNVDALADTEIAEVTKNTDSVVYTAKDTLGSISVEDNKAKYAVIKYKNTNTGLFGKIDDVAIPYHKDGKWHVTDVIVLDTASSHQFEPMSYIKDGAYSSIEMEGTEIEIAYVAFFDNYEAAAACQAMSLLKDTKPTLEAKGNTPLTITGWEDEAELKKAKIRFGAGELPNPSFSYDAIDKDTYKYVQEYITFNGKTVKEINESTDTSQGYVWNVFPSTIEGNTYKVPIILYQEDNYIELRVHSAYLEELNTDTYTIGIKKGLYFEKTNGDYVLEEDYTFSLQADSWIREKDITSQVSISGWKETGDADELIYTQVNLGEGVLPDSIAYGIIDAAAYKYIQNYLTINGRRISEINSTTDVSDYVFSTFPSKTMAAFQVPVVIYVNNGVIEIKVHKNYVESLEDVDIVIGVVGGLTIFNNDVNYKVTSNVSKVVQVGATDITSSVVIHDWVTTGEAQELRCTYIKMGEGVLPSGLNYQIMDTDTYKYIQEYITINGKKVSEINANTDVSGYVFSTFPSTASSVYKVPVIIFGNGDNLEVKIHEKYVEAIGDNGVVISVLEGLKITNEGTTYKVNEDIVQSVKAGVIDISSQIEVNGWGSQNELKYTNIHFGSGVLPAFKYGAIDANYKYIQKYIRVNGWTVEEINQNTNTSDWNFTVFPSSADVKYKVPIMLFQDGDNLTVKVHENYLAGLGEDLTIEILKGLSFENNGKTYKVMQTLTFHLANHTSSHDWKKMIVDADINGDGNSTCADIVRYKLWLANPEQVTINTETADLDADGDFDEDDIYWVRRVLLGDDITSRSESSLYFLSSDSTLDTFLNDYYSRHSRSDVTKAINAMELGTGNTVWKAWEAMSLVWYDSTDANFRRNSLELIKDSLNQIPIDDYGYVWSSMGALEDANTLPGADTFGMGWPFPNYSGFHEGDWEFNDSKAAWEEDTTWSVSGGSKSQANGYLTATANNSREVKFETYTTDSSDKIITPESMPFLELDLRWNLTGATEYEIYVSWLKSTSFLSFLRSWSREYKVSDYSVMSAQMGSDYAQHIYLPLHEVDEWNDCDNIYGVRIYVRAKDGSTPFSGNINLNFVRGNYDSRQIDNMYAYVDALKMYYEYTGDVDTLEANLNRARKAVMFLKENMTDANGMIDLSKFIGHNGGVHSDGQEDTIPSSYWDIISMPKDSIYAQVLYYQALESLEWLEEAASDAGISVAAPSVKTSATSRVNYNETVSTLGNTADGVASYVQNHYWDSTDGRFIDGHNKAGQVVDFGSTLYNNMVVAAGMATDAQAGEVLSWINGERIVAGDNSTGEDIYAFGFAPRTTTVQNENQYTTGYVATNPAFGASVQNGGAVLFTSYYDMLARFNVNGANDAYGRLTEIKDWYLDILNSYSGTDATQFYRSYYADKGLTLQGAGAEGALGLDTEFIENAIVYSIVPKAFFGLGSEDGKTLQIAPNLPAELDFWRMENLLFNNVKYDLEVSDDCVTIRNVSVPNNGHSVKVTLETEKVNPVVLINGKVVDKNAYTIVNGILTLTTTLKTQRIEIR